MIRPSPRHTLPEEGPQATPAGPRTGRRAALDAPPRARTRTIGLNLLYVHRNLGGVRNSGPGLCRAILERALPDPALRFRLFITTLGREVLAALPGFESSIAALRERCEVVQVPIDPRRKLRRFVYEQARLRGFLTGLDVLHSFDYAMPYLSRCRSVVMVRDLNYLNFPGTFSFAQRSIRRAAVPLSLRLAAKVVTISRAMKQEIVQRFGVPAQTVAVVHNSFSPLISALRPSAEPTAGTRALLEGPFVLAVGTLKLHKNYERLLEAFARLEDRRVRLVIVGRDDGRGDALAHLARELGLGERVLLAGFVSDPELALLYRSARLFVFPSLYEGFGMPLLEAMACRVAVACSDLEVFREVGGDAAAYFDPTDVAAMSRTLDGLLAAPQRRSALIAAGSARVGEFTWTRSAERMLEVYDELSASY